MSEQIRSSYLSHTVFYVSHPLLFLPGHYYYYSETMHELFPHNETTVRLHAWIERTYHGMAFTAWLRFWDMHTKCFVSYAEDFFSSPRSLGLFGLVRSCGHVCIIAFCSWGVAGRSDDQSIVIFCFSPKLDDLIWSDRNILSWARILSCPATAWFSFRCLKHFDNSELRLQIHVLNTR